MKNRIYPTIAVMIFSLLGVDGTSAEKPQQHPAEHQVMGAAAQASVAVGRTGPEIDTDVWAVISATVAAGDAVSMGLPYHPDAVLVTGNKTATIAQTLVHWSNEMAKAKRAGGRARVSFRFGKRQDNSETAFESGIFRYTEFDRAGAAKTEFIPFEVLLTKKSGKWRIMMERQLASVDEAAWEKLVP